MHTLTLHLQALAADTLTMAKYGFRLWRADIRELRLFHRDLRRAAELLAVSPSPTSSEHGEAIFLVTETAFGMASAHREGRWRPGHCRLPGVLLCRRGFMLSPVAWATAWGDGLQAEWPDDESEGDMLCD
jgi:hypothetical protein